MVQAFRFDGRGVSHRAHVLTTPKLVRETEAGRRLFSVFGTPVADNAPVRRADDVNTANISVLDHHGELLALWEGGSASVLDRQALQWQGFKVWGEGLAGLPFTAHPKVESDGMLWAFGYNLAPVRALVLYHIAADGTVVKAQALDPGPLGMVHDFVVTARHLVIVIPPLVYQPSHEGGLLDALAWRPDPRSDRSPSDSIRQTMTGRSEAAVIAWLSESVIKAHAPHVKARRAVAQPWLESGCRATESGSVDRVPAWLVATSAVRSPSVRISSPVTER